MAGTTAPGATVDVAVTGTAPGAARADDVDHHGHRGLVRRVLRAASACSRARTRSRSRRPLGGAGDQRGHLHRHRPVRARHRGAQRGPPLPAAATGQAPTPTRPRRTPTDRPTFAPDSFRLNGLTVINSGRPSHSRSGSRTCSPRSARCSARSSSTSTSTRRPAACPRARSQSTGGGRGVQLLDRARGRVEPAHRGGRVRHRRLGDARELGAPGCPDRPAWAPRRSRWPSSAPSGRRNAGPGDHHGADVRAGHARLGLDVHGHADRAGRLRQRRRPDVHGDARRVQRSGCARPPWRASSSPPAVCSVDPASVPFVMDTIPPRHVNVQTELDPDRTTRRACSCRESRCHSSSRRCTTRSGCASWTSRPVAP